MQGQRTRQKNSNQPEISTTFVMTFSINRRWRLRLAIAFASLLAVGSSVTLSSPKLRTEGYFLVRCVWVNHWPLSRGKRLPERIRPLFERILPFDPATVFDRIYENAVWGVDSTGKGHSGMGSTLAVTAKYRQFLEKLIRDENITSIVDAGCGDWQFSSHIDWGGAKYLGIDASTAVIKRVHNLYASPNVSFQRGDVTEPLPEADLLIIKDVLQHLPNRSIEKFIRSNLQPSRYRLAVITNDRFEDRKYNRDILLGEFRPLDLSREPFDLNITEEFRLFDDLPEKIVQVLRLEDQHEDQTRYAVPLRKDSYGVREREPGPQSEQPPPARRRQREINALPF